MKERVKRLLRPGLVINGMPEEWIEEMVLRPTLNQRCPQCGEHQGFVCRCE